MDFPVVAIGASAGALDALKKFFKAMPAESGMAFVVVVHLDPEHVSHLPELLGQHTAMGVTQVQDGERVVADHVYLIPPNASLSVQHGCLHLDAAVARPRIPMPIDHFLCSLAEDRQERSVAIILSGTGSDGTLGLQEIKAAGGMVMAQQADTAEYDGMPRSAIATGLVDVVLPVEAMPDALLDYVKHSELRGVGQGPMTDETKLEYLHDLLALLRLRGGYDFRCYKKGMLGRRVQRRMGLNHLSSLGDYCRYVRDSPTELKALAQDLLISVTAFFREPQAWEVLATEVIPALVAAKPTDTPIRVWVAGCATGEEAYSIGMLLLEQMDAHPRNGKIQIFATDIDKPALETARAGRYPESMAASFTPQRLGRFFTKAEGGYQVKKELRELVTFAPQNLVTDAPFSRLDLVICRNLLIYLEPELQRKVIGLFHFSLNTGGYLFLGKSETAGQRRGLFDFVSKPWRIYRRSETARHDRVDLPLMAGYRTGLPESWPTQRPRAAPQGYGEWVGNLLLQRYAPASVLVNRDHQILYFHGQTGDYLAQPTGGPTDDLLALARDGLRLKLRAGLHQAMSEGREVSVLAEVARGGVSLPVQVTVTPVEDPRQGAKLCLVTFRAAEPESAIEPVARAMEESEAIHYLEKELARVKHDLESAVEDLEVSNEELKVSNEEALSMNEELQSTNEELETSKEELQSLNEELTTVNTQLEEKIGELESSNNDLGNLLASTHLATLFLDRRFHIKRFTPASTRLFNLIPSDINRPITDIVSQCADAGMIADARHVLETLAPSEKEISTAAGEWYLRRVLPYRTQDDRIEGVVVTFTDITPTKRAALDLQRLGTVVRDSNDAVILFDFGGRILAWNRGAEAMYGYGEAEAIQLKIDALVPGELRPAQRELIERIRSGEAINSYETRRITRDGRAIDVWLTVSVLRDESGAPAAIATTERDVTERNQAEQALKASAARFRQLADANIIGIILSADEQGNILSANDAFLAIVGYTREELSAGKLRWIELTPPEYLALDRRAIAEARAHGACSPYEKEYIRKDGSRVPILTGWAHSQTSAGEYVCFVLDLSASKRLEAALREHTEVLIQANRRKDEFLAMLAHELRNPLAPVLNAAELLENHGGEDPKLVAWASALIKRQIGHLVRIVNDLLDIARIDRGRIILEKVPADLGRIIAQSVESCRPSSDARRQVLTLSLPGELIWADVDANRLNQVVGNLLDNAIKYTPEGGRIELGLAREMGEAVLRVRDTGIGMDAATAASAFDLFSQAECLPDRANGGLGIGLALVKRLVELHGGRVEASSAGLNQGSEFIVCLPALAPGISFPGAGKPARRSMATPRRILVVEDNADLADSFSRLLEAMGHRVMAASSGTSALQAVQDFVPEVAFLDIGLPGMDGHELARRLRLDPRLGQLKLIALSGYATEEDRQRSRQAGFDRHLAKPARLEEIEELLATLPGASASF